MAHSNNQIETRGAEYSPEQTTDALAAFDRRTFLRVMGASLAMAGIGGLGACSEPQPLEKIVPYVDSPEGSVPGVPRFYASALPTSGWVGGYGRGVIVEQHEGRPTKIEGNPNHPASLGGTDIFMQAAILQLYDPDRSKFPLRDHQAIGWGEVIRDLSNFVASRGDALRVRLLTPPLTSPTLIAQIAQLREVFPHFRWHVHDVLNGATGGGGNARQGQRLAFGRTLTPVFDLTRARRLVALDAHFLSEEASGTGGAVRYAREFASTRRLAFQDFGSNQTHRKKTLDTSNRLTADQMTRLYTAESSISFTGALADHRLPVKPSEIPQLLGAIGRLLLGNQAGQSNLPPNAAQWVAAAVQDLKSAINPLVLVGEYQPPEVHAVGYAINAALGAIGTLMRLIAPVEAQADGSLADLTHDMDSGEVDLVVILETNPAYTAPSDIQFADALKRFSADPHCMALSVVGYADETADLCRWHVPLSHPLEAWGDLRGHDGTTSIIQPLILPLWASKSAVEVLAALRAFGLERAAHSDASASEQFADGYELVQRHWTEIWKDMSLKDRDGRWKNALRDGIIDGAAATPITLDRNPDLNALLSALAPLENLPGNPIEIAFRPDPTIGDGTWSNHPWLQELPKPLTHITWETIALLAPATARSLGLLDAGHESRETVGGVRISLSGQTIDVPAWVQPGQPEGVITLYLGGGRRAGGSIQQGVGVNVYPLRSSQHLWSFGGAGLVVEKSAQRFALACTQPQQLEAGRDIVRDLSIDDVQTDTNTVSSPDLYSTKKRPDGRSVHLSLYDENAYVGYKWGMVVDLSACIGCSACVIACQAENNIPSVGKDQVRRGREMHWIRIDTYLGTTNAPATANLPANTSIHFQPMMCQHCENAPCELVCPVEATSHSEEGINEMTYNRCIGTRYCSNNCPYKVRRFNFLQFNDHDVLTWNMQKNPNVTVRSRGVMEKCNYCIQRVNRARINAKREWARRETNRELPVEMRTPAKDEWGIAKDLPRLRLQTACQQACPTNALVFGDLNDTDSLASVLKKEQPWAGMDYGVLTELNTQPRTSYLPRLHNRNPDLAPSTPGAVGGQA